MERYFIKKIHINKVRHLSNIDIPLSDDEGLHHLIITGKNGSGKTSFLIALSNYLKDITSSDSKKNIKNQELSVNALFNAEQGKIIEKYADGSFILAYFDAKRGFEADVPESIEKVQLKRNYRIDESSRSVFLKYMLDQKMVQALAISGGNKEKADEIQKWFDRIRNILREIYEDDELEIKFDEDSFRFFIITKGREPFDFNNASDGFSALLDIIVDLILRMQDVDKRTVDFTKPGIVLIDEIENHLHIELQKKVIGILTGLFPNVQFVISTHSPFVLNSVDDAVIFDLENKTLIHGGLSNVSYSGVVESYFNTDEFSIELRKKFDEYKILTQQKKITDEDFEKIASLEIYLDEIPDFLSLGISTEYSKLKLEFHNRKDI